MEDNFIWIHFWKFGILFLKSVWILLMVFLLHQIVAIAKWGLAPAVLTVPPHHPPPTTLLTSGHLLLALTIFFFTFFYSIL